MTKKGRIREKGTGSIVKQSNRFYLKIRTGSKTKSTTLRGKDDKPVTTRKEAEAAAALLRPVLRADQKRGNRSAYCICQEAAFPEHAAGGSNLAMLSQTVLAPGQRRKYA